MALYKSLMSSTDGRGGRLIIFPSPEARKDALWWALAALSVPVAGAAVWWLSENTINRLAPREVSILLGRDICFMIAD